MRYQELLAELKKLDLADTAALDAIEAQFSRSVTILLDSGEGSGGLLELEECVGELAEVLAGPVGRALEQRDAHRFDRWTRVLDRVSEELESGGERAVQRLLRSFGGKPQIVLDILAQRPDGVLGQKALIALLDTDMTYVSKVVRRLVEMDLVSQDREGRRRQVRITGAGRRLARDRILEEAMARMAPAAVMPLVQTPNTEAGAKAAALSAELCSVGGRPAGRWGW